MHIRGFAGIRRGATTLLAATTALAFLAACGGNASDAGGVTAAGKSSDAQSASPAGCAALKTKYSSLKGKTYVIAVDGDSPPDEYTDPDNPSQIIGGDADVIRDVMACLGLQSTIKVISFAGIIPALVSGQADIQASAMSYTAARAQQVNYVTFEKNATGFMSLKDKFTDVKDVKGLCGHRVGILVGGTAQTDIDLINKADCNGNNVVAQTYQDSSGIAQAVQNGRVDFGSLSLVTLQLFVKENPQFAVRVNEDLQGLVEGFSVNKSSTTLLNALYDALTLLQKNGVVKKDYAAHGMSEDLIEPAQIKTS